MENIEKKNGFSGTVMKGSLIGLCASLTLILIFAFMLRFFAIGDNFIITIVQIIKGLSIFFGVVIAMKKCKELGFITGLTIGIIYTLLAFLIFSILDNFTFEFSKTLLNDTIFGGIIGGISGIIAVNLKK